MTGAPDITTTDGHEPAIVRAAAQLLAESVPARCRGLVAYHAAGYGAYLCAALAPPAAHRTVIVRLLRTTTGVAAVADWRLLDGQLLLNGLAVRHAQQNRGLGSRLLHDGLLLAQSLGVPTLSLDVELSNTRARALYLRTGFRDVGYSTWTEVPAGRAPADPPVRVLDWPAFEAHRAAYGFGDLAVCPGTGPAGRIRLVGDALRVEPGAAGTRIARCLAEIVRPTRIYAIRPMSSAGGEGEGFARFARMQRSLS
jgi:GNAT superfamily N-acetyltransferase